MCYLPPLDCEDFQFSFPPHPQVLSSVWSLVGATEVCWRGGQMNERVDQVPAPLFSLLHYPFSGNAFWGSPPSCQLSFCSCPSLSEAQSQLLWLMCNGCYASRVLCPVLLELPEDRDYIPPGLSGLCSYKLPVPYKVWVHWGHRAWHSAVF